MNIWFVSIFENTPIDDNENTRYNSLVRESLNREHKVTFWASTFKHNEKKQRFDGDTVLKPEPNLAIRFIQSRPYSKNISFRRLLSHRDYAKRIIAAFERMAEKPDLLIVAFPPISVANSVSAWAKKHHIPCIVDIIDPWPEVFAEHLTYIPGFLFYPFRRSVRKTLHRVSGATAISNQYLNWAGTYNSGLRNTKCFYPAVQFDEMQRQLKEVSGKLEKKADRFRVIYAGSLGYSYDIPTILSAAALLEKEYGENIYFTIAGDGPQKDKVIAYERSHENLEYLGRIPKKELMKYYFLSDLGMTQHIKGATQSVTYKLFDLLACGLPILNSLESEMKDIIIENRVGMHNEPGNAEQLAQNIVHCFRNSENYLAMKENAISLTKKLGDSKIVYSRAMDFVESMKVA